MATNKHAIVRYIALDKCFSNTGRQYTIDDLIDVCAEAIYMAYGNDSGISMRTIRGDISFMKSEDGYSAPIETYKDGGKSYYRYSEKGFSINKKKLSTSETEQLKNTLVTLSRFKGLPQFEWMNEVVARLEGEFAINNQITEVVGFDYNPDLVGLSHFDGLFQAITNKHCLSVQYHPSFAEAVTCIIHPYYLKQYNNRWFLFGMCNEKIMNMPLDRIENFNRAECAFVENTNVNFNDYFDDVIGVSVPYNVNCQKIKLKIDRKRYKYIETKPIHPTQTEIKAECDEDSVVIKLDLIPNYEFETLLLSFADSIEILEPLSLKEKIKERSRRILEKNI